MKMSNTLTNSVINCKFYSNPALLQVDISDSGFYSCVAGNILGESVSSAYLEINRTSSLVPWPWLVVTALSLLLHCYCCCCCQHINTLNTPLL